ncbi:MAG: PhzF family phenazine biosynthesis protein [Candidatus Andeanibacterium colombiense]|uniref:PhzF family phenazine biosynthesis protein n=1 Tax=Candidatus Andeanibacterium colombiense TaxID=3121345 RepID=A0AAJ5X7C5_9SPHN|nr:MAG: PhzF family phenazine biosynthesis protein [Sphingomonadaceae bacterium]
MKLDLVDVFGSAPLRGNPLAVVHGAEGLDAAAMLALTRWLGFSETTFLLPPSDPAADYRVRIFYPAGELPFAGHPTLGTCHAWLEAGGVPKRNGMVVQQCEAGLVEVRRDGDLLAFRAPPMTRTGPLGEAELEAALRVAGVGAGQVLEAVHVANGPGWKMLRLATAEDVLAAEPAVKAPPETDIGLVGPHPPGSELAWEVRAFFADAQGRVVEDPVTGSFNAGVAMHLFGSGLASGEYLAGQGQKTGAEGIVRCSRDRTGAIWIGGRTATIARGAALPSFEA